ncbi:MAG: xylulokinase [Planctomycetota bacterium]
MTIAIGLDVGTQGVKGVAVDGEAGAVLARASAPLELLSGLPRGAAEQNPADWLAAIERVTHELVGAVGRDRVAAVGVSGQQHGLVALDADGAPVRAAKLWCDTSTADEAAELTKELGRPVPTGYTAPKVRWLAKHEPENWARTARVMLPHDFVNLVLTGEFRTEPGDASGTGWLDVRERRYDENALATIDQELASRVPPLLEPERAYEMHGRVRKVAAERFALPEGALVSAGGGDNMMSAIGSGATRAGVLVASLGTSGTVFAHCDQPVVDQQGLVAPFCGSTGGWLPLVCVMNLTGVAQEVRSESRFTHDELTERARELPLGGDGLMWLPYLQGERVPDLPRATGTLLGMRTGSLEPARLYRAALEGTSLNLAWGAQRLLRFGVEASEVRLVGGAAKNALWRELLAGAFALPVVALEEPESAALGAAVQALWSLSHERGAPQDVTDVAAPFVVRGASSEPRSSESDAYAQLMQRFRSEVKRLYGVG